MYHPKSIMVISDDKSLLDAVNQNLDAASAWLSAYLADGDGLCYSAWLNYDHALQDLLGEVERRRRTFYGKNTE